MSINQAERDFQHHCERVIQQNVNVSLSSLVSTLAEGFEGETTGDLGNLCSQAAELCASREDYGEAATQAGWKLDPHEGINGVVRRDATDAERKGNLGQSHVHAHSWEQACFEDDLEPYRWEVYEHWSVSPWLGEKLKAAGERVDDDFAGMVVWARTTTGQAVSMDGVIEGIVRGMLAAS